MKLSGRKLTYNIFAYVLLVLFSCVFIIPLLWQVATSLKYPSDVFNTSAGMLRSLIPERVRFQNYPDALTRIPFFNYLLNTFNCSCYSCFGTGHFFLFSGILLYQNSLERRKGSFLDCPFYYDAAQPGHHDPLVCYLGKIPCDQHLLAADSPQFLRWCIQYFLVETVLLHHTVKLSGCGAY